MHSHRLLATAAFLLLTAGSGHADQQQPPESPFVGQPKPDNLIYPGQVIVTFHSDADLHDGLDDFSRSPGVTAGLPDSLLPRRIGQLSLLISLSDSFSVTGQSQSPQDIVEQTWQAVQNYAASDRFKSVEPVYIARHTVQPDDPEFPRMWHYHSREFAPGGANFTGAWDITPGSRDIRVAVIDTGILPDEPEFDGSPNLINSEGVDLVSDPWMANDGDEGGPGDGVDYDIHPEDPGDGVPALQCGLWQSRDIPDSWHGSHVSGTAGAGNSNDRNGIAGAAWEVSVIPIRALGRCGGKTVDIAEAIRWAAGMEVNGVDRVLDPPADIINLSLGGPQPCSSVAGTIQAAIDDAVERGALVVAAAGNSHSDASRFYPAGCNNVITVAASGADGRFVERYSNFGEPVDIMAPGGDIRTDNNSDGEPDGVLSVVKDDYEFYNGTSMAAPHVSAALALLLSHRDDIRAMSGADKYRTVRELLSMSAVQGSAGECPRPCGAGLLDAEALLRQ